jgi:hypothetical protein
VVETTALTYRSEEVRQPMSDVSLLMPITLQKWTSLMTEGMLFVDVGLRVLGDGEIARIDYLSASLDESAADYVSHGNDKTYDYKQSTSC